ncbi:MAG: hypothetical protein HY253_12060 [Burkholderiales bacterium]|nr:hypothetical protein [Burkholderiales bacterium]
MSDVVYGDYVWECECGEPVNKFVFLQAIMAVLFRCIELARSDVRVFELRTACVAKCARSMWLALVLLLASQVAHGQACFAVGISCQNSSVRLGDVTERKVLKVFEAFSASESLKCQTLPGAPDISLFCEKDGGIQLQLQSDAERLWFVSRAPFGLKGKGTLRDFNTRLASFLTSQFNDAAETIRDTPPIPKIDRFSGIFLSESRERFGTSTPGEVRIEITRDGSAYYMNYFRDGKQLFATQAEECDPREYPIIGDDWIDETVSGLCTPAGHVQMIFTMRGLTVPEPMNPSRRRTFKSHYYSHVQWSFYAFRKVH